MKGYKTKFPAICQKDIQSGIIKHHLLLVNDISFLTCITQKMGCCASKLGKKKDKTEEKSTPTNDVVGKYSNKVPGNILLQFAAIQSKPTLPQPVVIVVPDENDHTVALKCTSLLAPVANYTSVSTCDFEIDKFSFDKTEGTSENVQYETSLLDDLWAEEIGSSFNHDSIKAATNHVVHKFEETTHDDLSWVRTIHPPPHPSSFPYYVTAPVEEMHKSLYINVFQLLMEEGLFFTSKKARSRSPFEYRSPDELRKEIDFDLRNSSSSHHALLELIRGVIKYQPHVSHPFFMEQGLAGLEPYSCISDLFAASTNSNNVLYIVSTVLTLLELELIRAVCKLVDYDVDGNGDGTITPGAGLANGYAMRMAVKQKFPWIKNQGLSGCKTPVFFVSQRSTYIQNKCAVFQGYGMDSVVSVPIDDEGRMKMEDLRLKIMASLAQGHVPCMVVGTAGTSVLRAIDPLDNIADICAEFGLWFHVDGTWGGALLFSPSLKQKLQGIERSDSFAWSQHFVLSVPCTSTCLVVPPRHKHKLAQYLGLGDGVGYAFMKTPLYDHRYDMGHNTLLSCRRPEMFKFWLMWKAKGGKALGRHVDYIFRNAQFCMEEMNRREGFHPILKVFEGTNVCFVYVPVAYRGIIQNTDMYREKISKLTLALRRCLLTHGVVSLSYNEIPENPTFLILGLHNSAVTRPDIVYVLDQIEHFGEVLTNPIHDRHHRYIRGGGGANPTTQFYHP